MPDKNGRRQLLTGCDKNIFFREMWDVRKQQNKRCQYHFITYQVFVSDLLTTFCGLPARKAATLPTTTFMSLWRAARAAQAM